MPGRSRKKGRRKSSPGRSKTKREGEREKGRDPGGVGGRGLSEPVRDSSGGGGHLRKKEIEGTLLDKFLWHGPFT